MKREDSNIESPTKRISDLDPTTKPKYPVFGFERIPIRDINSEIIFFHIPLEDIDVFYEYIAIDRKNEILDSEVDKAIIESFLKYYFNKNKNLGFLEKLDASYNSMQNVLPHISFAVAMPETFKMKAEIHEYLKMFKNVGDNIKSNFSVNSSNANFNFKLNIGNVVSSDKILLKYGSSFGKPDKTFIDSLTKSQDEDEQKVEILYKDVFKLIFANKYNDFRKRIIIDTINADQDFTENNFELFLFYFENFIKLFSGIQTKYFIDELGFLNLDFFANEIDLMNIAEFLHYQTQYRVLETSARIIGKESKDNLKEQENKDNISEESNSDDEDVLLNEDKQIEELEGKDKFNDIITVSDLKEPLISRKGSKRKKETQKHFKEHTLDKFIETNPDFEQVAIEKLDDPNSKLFQINMKQFHQLNEENPVHFPPYSDFTKLNAQFFRRYDKNDEYHICDQCSTLKILRFVKYYKHDLHCNSSTFRKIDKTRMIYSNLSHLMEIEKIKGDKKFKNIFTNVFICHDHREIENKVSYSEIIRNYVSPLETNKIKEMDYFIRNFYGENAGFYFNWVTHYINWIIFPALLGFIFFALDKFLDFFNYSSVYLYFNILFVILLMIWANFYNQSWENRETFFSYAWGMEDFKIDKSNAIENTELDQWDLLGVRMPILNLKKFYFRRILSVIVISICLVIVVIINLALFYVENNQLYADSDNNSNLITQNLKQISNGYWLYLIPIATFFIREVMGSMYKDIALYLTNREFHVNKTDYENNLLLKILFFQFFNFYFNLYYIAFVKRYYENCAYNDCLYELGNQITVILTSSIVLDCTKIFWYVVYQRNKLKDFENNIRENNLNANNLSSKYIYYTRAEYEKNNVDEEYLEVVLNFGYIIQFGQASPICFLIALLEAMITRLVDMIKMTKLQSIRFISKFLMFYFRLFKWYWSI